MRRSKFLLACALACLGTVTAMAARAPSAPAQTVVQVEGGLIAATRDSPKDILVFKMVPFATPPVGALRWKAPQPALPWKGVRRADKYSAQPMQSMRSKTSVFYLSEEENAEDCLYLNVWTPAASADAKRPVMVYIYGGGNTNGSGSMPLYDGVELARKGVVVVTFNYRVGIFGWFAHPDLSAESAGDVKTSGNYGLLDQIAALSWVKKNIAQLGGDPGNVTIFGQSAGSMDVSLLMASPLAKGLFHKAIGQSVSAFSGNTLPRRLEAAEKDGQAWALANLGTVSVNELREIPADRLLAAQLAKGFPYTTIVDGAVLPDYIENIFARGEQNDVPLMTGWNKDEGTPYPQMAYNAADYRKAVLARYGSFADKFLQVYPAENDADALKQSYASWRDSWGYQNWSWAEAAAATGKSKVFVYYWAYEPKWEAGASFDQPVPAGQSASKLGAYHGCEQAYVFRNLPMIPRRVYGAYDYKLSDIVSAYWINFARTGDPNGRALPRWPAYDTRGQAALTIGDSVVAGGIPNRAGLEFFKSFYEAVRPPLK